MKRFAFTVIAMFLGLNVGLMAQENRDVKKEKVTTKVKVDKGVETDTVVIEETEEEVEVVEVEGTTQTNQDSKRVKQKETQKVIVKERDEKAVREKEENELKPEK